MLKEKIFISYSRTDFNMVKALVSLVEASDIDVFIDIDDIKYGERWESVIEDRIKNADKIFIFWSERAAQSDFIRQEYLVALKIPQIKIVPVLLDETPLPSELSQFQAITGIKPLLAKEKVTVKLYRLAVGSLLTVLILGVMTPLWLSLKSDAQFDDNSTIAVSPTTDEPRLPTSHNGPVIRARARAPEMPRSDYNYSLAIVLFCVTLFALLVTIYILRTRRKRLISSITEIIVQN